MQGKGASHERIGCQIKQYSQIKMHQCPQHSVNWDAADVGRAFFHDGDEDTVSGIKQEQGDYQLAGVGAPELEDPVCGAVHLDVQAEVNHEYQQQKKSADDVGLFHRDIFRIEFHRPGWNEQQKDCCQNEKVHKINAS